MEEGVVDIEFPLRRPGVPSPGRATVQLLVRYRAAVQAPQDEPDLEARIDLLAQVLWP